MKVETKQDALAHAKQFAQDMLTKTGEIQSMVAIHGKQEGEVACLPYHNDENAPHHRWAIVETIKSCRKNGEFKLAVLISEAWMAKAPAGWKPGQPHTPASQAPDRQEVVVAHIVHDDGTTLTGFWELLRDADGKNPRLGEERKQDEGSVKSWIDRAVQS
jgi:hypothetical protein